RRGAGDPCRSAAWRASLGGHGSIRRLRPAPTGLACRGRRYSSRGALTVPRAIVIRRSGGPEVLALEPVEVGAPGPGEVRLRQTAIGVNFHDAYVRSGSYQTLKLPGVPGVEAAGVIDAVGPGVAGFRPGDRVGYVTRAYGAYAQERLIAANLLIPLPDTVSDQTAAATLVKGLTAWLLIAKLRPLKSGDVCLVHAAAGGVGRILTRWASWLGARVIGTVGDAAKAEIARADGCWETVNYREED